MLTYIDCCDDIVYPRARCQIHLQTQPKGNKVFTSPIISANMAKPNVSAADLHSKSRLHPQFGNILGLKLMKMTTPSRRASFASKRFLLLEEILPTLNGISEIIILRRHKSSGNKVDKITIIEPYR